MDFELTVKISLGNVVREVVIDYIESTVEGVQLPIELLCEVTDLSMTLINHLYEGSMESIWVDVQRGTLTVTEAKGLMLPEVAEFLNQGWPPLKKTANMLQDVGGYHIKQGTWG